MLKLKSLGFLVRLGLDLAQIFEVDGADLIDEGGPAPAIFIKETEGIKVGSSCTTMFFSLLFNFAFVSLFSY